MTRCDISTAISGGVLLRSSPVMILRTINTAYTIRRLTQCHVNTIEGFLGQTTAFRKSLLKKFVTILAQPDNYNEVRYIHGNLGRGTFTFLSGHDPEDYQHRVHDPPTDLSLHKNSPGYRLILNDRNRRCAAATNQALAACPSFCLLFFPKCAVTHHSTEPVATRLDTSRRMFNCR